jgi:hypothetical protein
MEERPGSAWFGLPAIIGVLALVAVLKTFPSLVGIVGAVFAVLVVFLMIGAAMTLVKKR